MQKRMKGEYVGVPDTYDESKPAGRQAIPLDTKLKDSYLTFESADGNVKYRIDGRVMLDTAAANNSEDGADENDVFTDTFSFRRVRLAVKGIFYKDWEGEFDVDFADTDRTFDLKDAWMAYNGFYHTSIKVGNHKPNFSIDEVTTSRWNNLIETSMASDVFSSGRRIGVSINHWDRSYFVGASAFGDEWDVASDDEKQSERFGWSVRGVYRPIVSDDGNRIVHLGVNLKNEKPQSGDGEELRYRSRPEFKFINIEGPGGDDGSRYLNTGKFEADSAFTWGVELAGKYGPFYAQAEYLRTSVDLTSGGDDPDFDGWYIKGGWFITGGEREYGLSDGEFGKVFPDSKWGALEVVARYSTLNLNDESAGFFGGEADNLTLGLNWYINNNFLIRANYINVDNDKNADGDGDFVGDDDLDIFALRTQWLF